MEAGKAEEHFLTEEELVGGADVRKVAEEYGGACCTKNPLVGRWVGRQGRWERRGGPRADLLHWRL